MIEVQIFYKQEMAFLILYQNLRRHKKRDSKKTLPKITLILYSLFTSQRQETIKFTKKLYVY